MINLVKERIFPFIWTQLIKQGFAFVLLGTFAGFGIGYFWSENKQLKVDIKNERAAYLQQIEEKNEELMVYLNEDKTALIEALNNNSRVMENMMVYLKGKSEN